MKYELFVRAIKLYKNNKFQLVTKTYYVESQEEIDEILKEYSSKNFFTNDYEYINRRYTINKNANNE